MVNIDRTSYLVSEVEEYIEMNTNSPYAKRKLEVVNVNSTSFNNGTGRDYQFGHTIKHPETGETLKPVKGYVGLNESGQDRCYYAEYQDSKGVIYSYTFKFPCFDRESKTSTPKKTISQQLSEDAKTLEEKLAKDNPEMGM